MLSRGIPGVGQVTFHLYFLRIQKIHVTRGTFDGIPLESIAQLVSSSLKPSCAEMKTTLVERESLTLTFNPKI